MHSSVPLSRLALSQAHTCKCDVTFPLTDSQLTALAHSDGHQRVGRNTLIRFDKRISILAVLERHLGPKIYGLFKAFSL